MIHDKLFPQYVFFDRHKVLITHGTEGGHDDISLLKRTCMIIGRIAILLIFSEGSEVISLSAGGYGFLVGKSESFTLLENGGVFGIVSGGVAGVGFGGFDVGGVEEYFFSNIHFTFS